MKWEYKMVGLVTMGPVASGSLEQMNKLGADGWELVGISTGPAGNVFGFFKRTITA